jgi:glutamine synthetase
MHVLAEYIWMDGGSEDNPIQHLRSKTRVIDVDINTNVKVSTFPVWGFDGSSTNQATTSNSDQVLKPVRVVNDPIRGGANFLVLCEVETIDGDPHPSNTRANLRNVLDDGASSLDAWFGFEQEYTLYKGRNPLGWPDNGAPSRNQGPYYCGVGADEVAGREMVEAHLRACMRAGIMIYGINAEVMLGQWEYQIGHRDFPTETADPLTVSDHLWLSRWVLYRIGENFGITAKLSCKPEPGDWNGAGAHTNFSTKEMRDKVTGKRAIVAAIDALSKCHKQHIADYGHGLEQRLTGQHETCSIDEFVAGESNRGASIRIPAHVNKNGYGYIEDRRPGANCDPYKVCARILKTVCHEIPATV